MSDNNTSRENDAGKGVISLFLAILFGSICYVFYQILDASSYNTVGINFSTLDSFEKVMLGITALLGIITVGCVCASLYWFCPPLHFKRSPFRLMRLKLKYYYLCLPQKKHMTAEEINKKVERDAFLMAHKRHKH
jgi:hypothetical protein